MSYLLLYRETWSPAEITAALEAALVEPRGIWDARDLVRDPQRPTVFLLDPESRSSFPPDALRRFVDSGGAIVMLGCEGEEDVPDGLPTEVLTGFVPHPARPRQLLVAIRAGFREGAGRAQADHARKQAQDRTREIGELTRIGMMLGTERDPNALLEEILRQARRLTESDAGSLFLIKTKREIREQEELEAKGAVQPGLASAGEEEDRKVLWFRLAQNDSLPGIPFKKQELPLDRTSLAGYTAVTGDALNIEDAYHIPADVEYKFQRSIDDRFGYRTKSMLVIPMKDHKDEMIGVLQLINRKRDPDAVLATPEDVERQVIRYSKRTQDLVSALAGQAAVSIENNHLLQEIEKLFEGFVQASVHAIEQRDPITQGHSKRVAGLTVSLAEVVDRANEGPYRDLRFSREQLRELEVAGLLHDFGKVGVREDVLQKRKKLYPLGIERIEQRHAFIMRTAEREFWRKQVQYLRHSGRDGFEEALNTLTAEYEREKENLNRFLETVLRANEPKVTLDSEASHELLGFATRTYESLSGEPLPLLTPDEVRYLSIPRGSLDESERKEIEGHVNHTYEFLSKIQWTRTLKRVPAIAFGHHEKLDGSGYPRRVSAEKIPAETRMMTISDIYDALTAPDRPYKYGQTAERALDILRKDFVQTGQLDGELFRLFVEAKVFEKKFESRAQ